MILRRVCDAGDLTSTLDIPKCVQAGTRTLLDLLDIGLLNLQYAISSKIVV